MTCGYQDNLGFGFHTALGVKPGNPDWPVVAMTGDGGFIFGVQELATAVHRIGLVTVAFDNNGYGNVRRDRTPQYRRRTLGSELVNPDFMALAEAFGARADQATDPEGLEAAIQAALDYDLPTIIQCRSIRPTRSARGRTTCQPRLKPICWPRTDRSQELRSGAGGVDHRHDLRRGH